MNIVDYDPRSPYSKTQQTDKYVQYLDFWNPVVIPAASSDLIIEIETKYTNRPDLLAFDLYGTAQLWWIFASRNPDIIKDPIYDMLPGIKIYAPSTNNIGSYL